MEFSKRSIIRAALCGSSAVLIWAMIVCTRQDAAIGAWDGRKAANSFDSAAGSLDHLDQQSDSQPLTVPTSPSATRLSPEEQSQIAMSKNRLRSKLQEIEMRNAKHVFEKTWPVGAEMVTLQIRAPDPEDIGELSTENRAIRDALPSHLQAPYQESALRLLSDYCDYPDGRPFKVLTLLISRPKGKESDHVRFTESFEWDTKAGLPDAEGSITHKTGDRYMQASRWAPQSWAFERYRHLFDVDPANEAGDG